MASASQASPGKRIHQRSECINQLKKLHKLMEDGIVSEEQYREMHKKIMADIQWTRKSSMTLYSYTQNSNTEHF